MSRIILPADEFDYPVVTLDYITGIDPIDVWIKFTSYITNKEKDFIKEIDKKNVKEITKEDINNYQIINNQLSMAKLLIKYKYKDCTKKEYDKVINFMENNDLEEFISKRITEKEKIKINELIQSFDKESLNKFIESKNKKFNSLSIYNAYFLLLAKKKLYNINNKELTDKIIEEQKKNDIHLHKSLTKKYGPIK